MTQTHLQEYPWGEDSAADEALDGYTPIYHEISAARQELPSSYNGARGYGDGVSSRPERSAEARLHSQRTGRSSRGASPRATGRALGHDSLLERFVPEWGKKASASLTYNLPGGSKGRTFKFMIGFVIFLIGLSFLFGGGYASIQGLRIPLQRMGLPVSTAGFPAFQWWGIPVFLSFIEILTRRFDGLRLFWWPAYIFDGATNALFFSSAIQNLLLSFNKEPSLLAIALPSAFLGLLLAVLAEQIVLTGLHILRTSIQRPARPVRYAYP
jgi:hypothetical protein